MSVSVREALGMPEGETVVLRGWVYRKRELRDKVFIVIRDSTGVIQAVFTRGTRAYDVARTLNIESSLVVRGGIKVEPRAPGGKELHVTDVLWHYVGRPYPINEDAVRADSEYLLDIRHLWVRSRRFTAVLKVRHTVGDAIREYFSSRGFYEVHAPTFISAAVEGGATLFEVPYFDTVAYLTQSSQFYLEALIFSLEKVYTVQPSFRAEKSRTRRHLTEFWHAEAEAAWCDMDCASGIAEGLIRHVVRRVLDERQDELGLLGRGTGALEAALGPFHRMSYDEAVEILRGMGMDVRWGDDIGSDEERALTSKFDRPIVLYGFPENLKAFYHRNDPGRPEVTLSFDILAPEGYGEVVGGGERIYEEEELVGKILRFGLDPKDYEWYIDLRRYGSVPHAGFGLGVDRLVMWLVGADHVRDVVPFPRDVRRVKP